MRKKLLTGNEAVARGAWEGGLVFASAYPGTPSTEILENLANYKDDLYCEWAPNEKVAFEAASGASIAGVRSMATMKHVGVNVAADPLFTQVYTGVTGGLILVSADDPGLHSSQNEQDNRNYATATRILMLEPSDSQEAKDFTKLGFELSEEFDTPVMLRMTTRVCHSKSIVEERDRAVKDPVKYEKNISKYVATPGNARIMREKLIGRIEKMTAYSNKTPINKAEYNDTKIGVISSGVAYHYARDVFGDSASYLKLGMTFPMPMDLIKEFVSKVDKIYVIEEMDPYIENHLKMAGIDCIGKEVIPQWDELNADIIRKAVFGEEAQSMDSDIEAVPRPPAMCAGCPHRGFFYSLSKKKNIMITGDIGCYTLGAAPPLSALDTTLCMGASISQGHGAAKAFKQSGSDERVISVIGDSTFFHSGVLSLMDVAYNKGNTIAVILDNRITAMTGQQQNPGTGFTLMGEPTIEVDIPALCKSLGFKEENIKEINPLKLDEVDDALEAALNKDEASVIITKWPCALKKYSDEDMDDFDLSPKVCRIDQDKCTKCRMCVQTGCPAIYASDTVTIDESQCNGCTVCMQVCPFDAIEEVVL